MNLDVTWHAGSPSPKHDTHPPLQVHRYDEQTWILRQNKAVNYEGPFLFLLAGTERAMLVDTGATADPAHFPLRDTIDELIGSERELLVVHTHAHGDHVAADAQFEDRPSTTVVGKSLDDVTSFYGLTDWPVKNATLDLGDRVVDVIPGPGHQESAVVFYDRTTGLLLTGDTLYRGRLYVFDWSAYRATIARLVDFCAANPVTHVLGCHIEMSTKPGHDYPIGAVHQPDEPPLQMTVDHLHALRDALDVVGDDMGIHYFDDFVIHRHAVHDHTAEHR
ncbi:MBL fold metallo-hydrolase [Lentzea tibetensis]|uniref:MBL fold metallo-hydrolase n=1 Tax=Lentzea tibetensis TaxID=2591470 RepID=UPI001C99A8C2|nr:MBL fold metallo-hydrolase [Lentzea tibetensis]